MKNSYIFPFAKLFIGLKMYLIITKVYLPVESLVDSRFGASEKLDCISSCRDDGVDEVVESDFVVPS